LGVNRREFLIGGVAIGLGLASEHQAWAAPDRPAAEQERRRMEGPDVGNRNRAVNVATVSQDGISDRPSQEYLEETLTRLEWSACRSPDIVCLPENFPGLTADDAQPVPGPLTERLGAWAREKHCYVVVPYRVKDGPRQYNSAVLLDRQGEVIGQYDKIHPVDVEIERGITPGHADPPVFKTDFGTIGIQICFDVNWPQTWRQLKGKGAEIVFFPSAFPAARHLSLLARSCEYYVVSSTRSRPSSVFDITGEVIASSGMFQPWADATLHLSKRLFEIDGHTGKMRRVEAKYGRRICVKWYHDEDQFTLASLDPDLAVEDIIREFELTPLSDYVACNEAAQESARPK
jgi:beta-ureidopropionase